VGHSRAKTIMFKHPLLVKAVNIEQSLQSLQGLLTSSHVPISSVAVVTSCPSILLMSAELMQQKWMVYEAAWALHPDWLLKPEDVTAPTVGYWLSYGLNRLERITIIATTGQTLLPKCSILVARSALWWL
jgi:hypothetical protein